MNEIIFLLHSFLLAGIALGALYIGKEALTVFVCISGIVANMFVIKQITLFGFDVTATDAFIIGNAMAINMLNEYYGRENARRALWIALASSIIVLALMHIHLWYAPNGFDQSHYHFQDLFVFMPRIVIASLLSYLITQTTENYFYALLKKRFNNRFLIMRNWITIGSTQLLDTILFSFLGLYGIVENITHIIFISYSIKILAMFLMTPALILSASILRLTSTMLSAGTSFVQHDRVRPPLTSHPARSGEALAKSEASTARRRKIL